MCFNVNLPKIKSLLYQRNDYRFKRQRFFSASSQRAFRKEIEKMLTVIGVNSMETLISETVPSSIRPEKLNLPAAKSEYNYIKDLKKKKHDSQLLYWSRLL